MVLDRTQPLGAILDRVLFYLGVGLFVVGFLTATAFFGGHKGGDAVAGQYIDNFTLWIQIGGIMTGVVLMGLGVALGRLRLYVFDAQSNSDATENR